MPSQETLHLLAHVYLAHVPLSPVNIDELKSITWCFFPDCAGQTPKSLTLIQVVLFPDPSAIHQSGQSDTIGGQDSPLDPPKARPTKSKDMIKTIVAIIKTVF